MTTKEQADEAIQAAIGRECEFLRKLQETRATRQAKNKSTCCLNGRIDRTIGRIERLSALTRS